MINNRNVTICVLLTLATVTTTSLNGEDPAILDTAFVPLGKIDNRGQLDSDVRPTTVVDSHPLLPTLKIANEGYQKVVDEIRDYTCLMVKREFVDGRLRGPEFMFAKVRHEQTADGQVVAPFSIYMKFKGPAYVQDREVLYVRGHADDKLIVKNGGKRLGFLTLALEPTSTIAMAGSRYPITEFGIKRLIERMIILGQRELAYEECEVKIRDDAQLYDEACTCIEVKHPVQREHFQYHLVRIFIDNDLQLPIRFESYDWPQDGETSPVLKEEYTYRDIKLNVGLTDADFERSNPEYGFR